jgi:hypothetical protein
MRWRDIFFGRTTNPVFHFLELVSQMIQLIGQCLNFGPLLKGDLAEFVNDAVLMDNTYFQSVEPGDCVLILGHG